MDSTRPSLLWVFELGGYPNFTPLFEQLGYRVTRVDSGRKAMAHLKQELPTVIVAEFNALPSFRDRTSNLESILAALQRHNAAGTHLVAFYDPENAPLLEKLRQRFERFTALPYPVDPEQLKQTLSRDIA